MNNWRLLLLAVVAVLQPNWSFTESNLIDGRQGCCDHRSTTQESNLYGNYRKTTSEDHRLNKLPIREDSRRLVVRSDPILRSRERLTVERTERRVIPDTSTTFSTEVRFARDQELRQRSLEARESRHTREDRSRRTRENIFRDSLTPYERDALDSRRVRLSRDDARIGRDTTRTVRDADDYRRDSANRETMERNRNNVARDEIRRDSRIDTLRFGNRVQNNNERRSFDRRARENMDETRRSRSAESRDNSVYAENRRSTLRDISERVDGRRQEFRKRAFNQPDSSERVSRNYIERQDQTRQVIRENRLNERVTENRQHRGDSRISRERSSELRESRPITDHRLAHESRILNANVRLVRNERSNDKTEIRREIARDLERVSRDRSNKRRLSSRAREATHVLETMRSEENREDRRQPLTRSLDRVVRSSASRSNEREVRISDRTVREKRATRNRREVRSAERLDDLREQLHESRMSRERQMANLRESRDSSERRQDTVSPYRVELNVRLERESRLREIRDNKRSDLNLREREERSREQALIRQTRDTERRDDSRMSRNLRTAERASDEQMSRMRDDIRSDVSRETIDVSRARVVEARLLTRDISAPTARLDTRRTSRIAVSESRLQRARTLENIRNERREVRERDESRIARDKVSMTRLARERIDSPDYKIREIRDSRIDTRYETIRNRGSHVEKLEARDESERRSRDLALQRQTRDNAARSTERRSREVSRNAENRAKRLSMSRDERRVSDRDVLDVTTVESRRENRMMERQVQPNRHLAIERTNRVANRESNGVKFEAKQRSTDASRSNTRRETETRFRNFAAKVREADSIDETYGQGVMSWQMVFYTLQGVYLCGLLMQTLGEKSNKGKTRNFAWWSSAKELIKVD